MSTRLCVVLVACWALAGCALIGSAAQPTPTGYQWTGDVGGAEASGLHDALGGIGMPMTAFYSARGKLVAVAQGALSAAELKLRLQQYFGF